MSTIITNRRSVMTLYSKALDPYSHRVRIVLAEKAVAADILDVEKMPKVYEELVELNPYGAVPTFTDRDLVLYHSNIIMEYLDERFPHPPLMPVYPVARARTRLMMYRIQRDWYSLLDKILQENGKNVQSTEIKLAKKELTESLLSVVPVFNDALFFFSEEFSLLDCCIAPLLWRLPSLGITLPSETGPIRQYETRIFARESFVASLTEEEKKLRG